MELHKFNQARQQTEERCDSRFLEYLDIRSCLRRRFSERAPSVERLVDHTKLVENTKSHQVIHQKESRNSLKVDSKVTVLPYL